jgi:hypothetical protein
VLPFEVADDTLGINEELRQALHRTRVLVVGQPDNQHVCSIERAF